LSVFGRTSWDETARINLKDGQAGRTCRVVTLPGRRVSGYTAPVGEVRRATNKVPRTPSTRSMWLCRSTARDPCACAPASGCLMYSTVTHIFPCAGWLHPARTRSIARGRATTAVSFPRNPRARHAARARVHRTRVRRPGGAALSPGLHRHPVHRLVPPVTTHIPTAP